MGIRSRVPGSGYVHDGGPTPREWGFGVWFILLACSAILCLAFGKPSILLLVAGIFVGTIVSIILACLPGD